MVMIYREDKSFIQNRCYLQLLALQNYTTNAKMSIQGPFSQYHTI